MIPKEQTVEQLKVIGDYAAGATTVAVVMGWLTPIAAALTIVYTAVRLWESDTARRLLRAVCQKCFEWWER
jgi:hypothetical protein